MEKYGSSKNLHYQDIENKIINNINNLLNESDNKNELYTIENQIKIIEIKILKYSKEETLNKIKIIFKEFDNNLFISKYINYYNYICFHFLNYFLKEEENGEENDYVNNEACLEELVKLIKSKINIEKFDI